MDSMESKIVDGWDEPPPPALIRGLAQFNAGEYWECHETLEVLWRADPRPIRALYQGILQVGVAFYHLHRGNYNGAVPKHRGILSSCCGAVCLD